MTGEDRIERCTVRGWPEAAPPPAIRSVRPRAMPPAWLLLVRSLAVETTPPELDGALTAAVEVAFAGAVRAWEGQVPPGAQAVLFREEAELLAAFCLDVALRGARPWWHSAAGLAAPDPVSALRAAGHVAPAAIVRLEELGALAAVLETADADVLETLAEELASCAGAEVRLVARDRAEPGGDRPRRAGGGVPRARGGAVRADRVTVLARRMRAAPFVPVAECGSPLETVAAVARWLTRRPAAPAPPPVPIARPPRTAAEPPASRPAAFGSPSAPAGAPPQAGGAEPPAADGRVARPLPGAAPGESAAPSSPTEEDGAAPVQSLRAGLFYLVNVLTAVDPVDALAGLDPWDLLDAVARTVSGGADGDPVWTVLAELAGRGLDPLIGAPAQPDLTPAAERAVARLVASVESALLPEPGERPLLATATTPGRIHRTTTTIDVGFELDSVQLRIRARGLDRDPGWVPMLGHVIRFHYGDPRW